VKEKEFLGNVSGLKTWLEAVDRADEMEDAVTLGRECACEKNDPNCAECWLDLPVFDNIGPTKFAIVKESPDGPVPEQSQFDEDVRNRFDECLELLLRKHKDYGPANIANAPGGPLNGLRVRMHDKLARINHLIDSGVEPSNESLRDSFLDAANYAVIALLVLDNVWPGMEKK